MDYPAELPNLKVFDKSRVVVGKSLRLRAATIADAAFVFQLRRDPKVSRYLHSIEGSVHDQELWLARCHADPYQIYFVIESQQREALGLVRIYDQIGDSFCWGSWVIKNGAPSSVAIESALLVYRYALDVMHFAASHFEVMIGNRRVVDFHQRFGAVEVARNNESVFFKIDADSIRKALLRYGKFLPKAA